MNNNYEAKYKKYKSKYLILKKETSVFINNSINNSHVEELELALQNKYRVIPIYNNQASGEIYITNTLQDCNQSKSRFNKIILLAQKQDVYNLEHCSITCDTMQEIINYLLMDDYKLGFTYLMDGNSGLRKLELHKMLRSWKIVYGTPKYVDFIMQEPRQDGRNAKEIYQINCTLKNMVDVDSIEFIVNKEKLYYTMKNMYQDYLSFMPEMTKLNEITEIKNQVLIAKPVGAGAHSGKGISIIFDNDELIKSKQFAKKNKQWKWITTVYIKNPLLFKGLKFHLRCHLMVTTSNKFFQFPIYEILTAEEPYQQSDFTNKKIHDSHGSSTLHGYFYPRDLNDPRIKEQVEKIMNRIILSLKDRVKSYAGNKYAYEILGVDILIDDLYNGWLIEVNNKIGRGAVYPYKEYQKYEHDILTWEYNSIIKPTFSKIKLIPMEKLENNAIDELLLITTDLKIMTNIGKGELWDRNKIVGLMQDSKKDANTNAPRKYFHWAIQSKYGFKKIVGYVGLRPMFKQKNLMINDNDLQIRLFAYPSQGFGTQIIKKIIKFIDNNPPLKLWATVHIDNNISLNFFHKLRWKNMGEITVGGERNTVFLYEKN